MNQPPSPPVSARQQAIRDWAMTLRISAVAVLCWLAVVWTVLRLFTGELGPPLFAP
jgi:hypothetical protein